MILLKNRLTFRVRSDDASPTIDRLVNNLSPQRTAAVIGPAVVRLFRANFLNLGHNHQGWPTTRFHAKCALATNWRPDPTGVVINVNKTGARQRYRGGPIRPVSKRALTIPVSAMAYGHTAADFPGLFRLCGFLVQRAEKTGLDMRYDRELVYHFPESRPDLNFLFALRSYVYQDPNPSFLPNPDDIYHAAEIAITDALCSRTKGGSQ